VWEAAYAEDFARVMGMLKPDALCDIDSALFGLGQREAVGGLRSV
jgi:hypothetical protein